jgi:hypothetical protein
VGLERSSLSLVSTTEELLGRKSSGSGLEKLALTSPTSCCRQVGIVRSRTQATDIVCYVRIFVQLRFTRSGYSLVTLVPIPLAARFVFWLSYSQPYKYARKRAICLKRVRTARCM